MNDASNGVLVGLVAVLILLLAGCVGFAINNNSIIQHCQNFEKFTAQGMVFECKEVGVAK
jgi:hypothetical protein